MRKNRAIRDLAAFQRHHPQVSCEGLKELPEAASRDEIKKVIEDALENAQDYLRDECRKFLHNLYHGAA